MKRVFIPWLGVIAAVVMLLLVLAFLGVPIGQGITVPNLPAKTILTGGVVGAIVGFVGVLIAQYLAGKRHSEALLQARELETQRAQEAARLEAQRAQEASLQRYFEQVGKLLADPDRPLHRSSPGDTLSTVARAQTLSILEGLDEPARKRILVQFLYESGLIYKHKAVVDLLGANLLEADLSYSSLGQANLARARLGEANLFRAGLQGANLQGANLQGANLQGANLFRADLRRANLQAALLQAALLQGAALWDAILQEADLQEADLQGANLQGANLQGANLLRANLQGANLREVDWLTQEQIESTIGPSGTKLPEGLNRPELWSKSLEEQIKILQERSNRAE